MRQRDKEKYTRENVISEIRRLEKWLAGKLVDNSDSLDKTNFNTVQIHQNIGRLKGLRGVLVE